MNNKSTIDGIMIACQYLVLQRDEPTFAEEIMKESGFTYTSFINGQKRTQYENKKMNKVINRAFGKER